MVKICEAYFLRWTTLVKSLTLRILHKYIMYILAFITRRCKVTCQVFSDIGLAERLYIQIETSNRSWGELENCSSATNILINLARFPGLQAVWYPNHLDKIVTVMSHCCDKDMRLFPNLCTLLWLLANDDHYKQLLLDIPNVKWRFSKIGEMVARKQRMVGRATTTGVGIAMSNKFFCKYKQLPMPMVKPDWGFDYPNRPRVFENSVHAFTCLMNILNL